MVVNSPTEAFELRRIQFVPAQRLDLTPVPTGVDIIVLNGVLPVCFVGAPAYAACNRSKLLSAGLAGSPRLENEGRVRQYIKGYSGVVQAGGRQLKMEDRAQNGVPLTLAVKAFLLSCTSRIVTFNVHSLSVYGLTFCTLTPCCCIDDWWSSFRVPVFKTWEILVS